MKRQLPTTTEDAQQELPPFCRIRKETTTGMGWIVFGLIWMIYILAVQWEGHSNHHWIGGGTRLLLFDPVVGMQLQNQTDNMTNPDRIHPGSSRNVSSQSLHRKRQLQALIGLKPEPTFVQQSDGLSAEELGMAQNVVSRDPNSTSSPRTVRPTFLPSNSPSLQPSTNPSEIPSSDPSSMPSTFPFVPSESPSRIPSSTPSLSPSLPPSTTPSTTTSHFPSIATPQMTISNVPLAVQASNAKAAFEASSSLKEHSSSLLAKIPPPNDISTLQPRQFTSRPSVSPAPSAVSRPTVQAPTASPTPSGGVPDSPTPAPRPGTPTVTAPTASPTPPGNIPDSPTSAPRPGTPTVTAPTASPTPSGNIPVSPTSVPRPGTPTVTAPSLSLQPSGVADSLAPSLSDEPSTSLSPSSDSRGSPTSSLVPSQSPSPTSGSRGTPTPSIVPSESPSSLEQTDQPTGGSPTLSFVPSQSISPTTSQQTTRPVEELPTSSQTPSQSLSPTMVTGPTGTQAPSQSLSPTTPTIAVPTNIPAIRPSIPPFIRPTSSNPLPPHPLPSVPAVPMPVATIPPFPQVAQPTRFPIPVDAKPVPKPKPKPVPMPTLEAAPSYYYGSSNAYPTRPPNSPTRPPFPPPAPTRVPFQSPPSRVPGQSFPTRIPGQQQQLTRFPGQQPSRQPMSGSMMPPTRFPTPTGFPPFPTPAQPPSQMPVLRPSDILDPPTLPSSPVSLPTILPGTSPQPMASQPSESVLSTQCLDGSTSLIESPTLMTELQEQLSLANDNFECVPDSDTGQRCTLDYQTLPGNPNASIEQECNALNGQYVQVSYGADCSTNVGGDDTLSSGGRYFGTNVGSCMATSCTEGESTPLFEMLLAQDFPECTVMTVWISRPPLDSAMASATGGLPPSEPKQQPAKLGGGLKQFKQKEQKQKSTPPAPSDPQYYGIGELEKKQKLLGDDKMIIGNNGLPPVGNNVFLRGSAGGATEAPKD